MASPPSGPQDSHPSHLLAAHIRPLHGGYPLVLTPSSPRVSYDGPHGTHFVVAPLPPVAVPTASSPGEDAHHGIARRQHKLTIPGSVASGSTTPRQFAPGESSKGMGERSFSLPMPQTRDAQPEMASRIDYGIIDTLVEGFREWKLEFVAERKDLFHTLPEGQKPRAMIIACSDSRVHPVSMFKVEPGEIFMVRNVANLVPPYSKSGGYHGTSAALEYGVCVLQVQHIIVCGHTGCGGIKVLMKGEKARNDQTEGDFIDAWVQIAVGARERTKRYFRDQEESFEAQCAHCEKEAINDSLNNLLTFPWITEKVKAKQLMLHGWLYNLTEGSLSTWSVDFKITDYKKII